MQTPFSPLRRRCGMLAAFVAVLCSCSDAGSGKEAGRATIKYWDKWTGFEADAMRAVVDDFNAGQDRIFVEYSSVSQIDRRLMLATSGKFSSVVSRIPECG